jgi:adenosine deaminase
MSPLSTEDLAARARALPKVLLHEHLDGGLRVPTVLQLLQQRGIAPPAPDAASLHNWFAGNAHAGSLEKYLEGFALTVAAMATPEALRRVAREAAEDAAEQGAVLAEFRIAPLLFEPHGVAGEAAVEAMLQGLAEGPIPSGLIVCAIRNFPAPHSERSARLAAAYAGRGVVGFDLAGGERGFPATEHRAAIDIARSAGLGLTLHAGEADEAERVIEAGRLGATRIGHGVRLVDALASAEPVRRALVDEARALGLHLEVCPTSNVHTGAARSIAEHPITALWRAGVSLSYHTDNRLMSCIALDDEAAALLRETPLQEADLLEMARLAARASFMPAADRARALAAIEAHAPGPDQAPRRGTGSAGPLAGGPLGG